MKPLALVSCTFRCAHSLFSANVLCLQYAHMDNITLHFWYVSDPDLFHPIPLKMRRPPFPVMWSDRGTSLLRKPACFTKIKQQVVQMVTKSTIFILQWRPDCGHQKNSSQDLLAVQKHPTGSQTSQVRQIGHAWSTSYAKYFDSCYSCRELDHPNLCKFIGGCVEVPNVAIVTEYCPKGSLNDVLLNEEIPLNWGFRYTDWI